MVVGYDLYSGMLTGMIVYLDPFLLGVVCTFSEQEPSPLTQARLPNRSTNIYRKSEKKSLIATTQKEKKGPDTIV